MLARLDRIHGVTESRVDWTGRRFLLRVEPDASASLVAKEAEVALGDGASILDIDETSAALGDLRRGEAWMRAGETLRLSQHEAQVLGKRCAEEAASEMRLDEAATRRLVDVFTSELNAAFERTHAAKSGDRSQIETECGEAAKRILASSESFLTAERRTVLAEYLQRFGGPRSR